MKMIKDVYDWLETAGVKSNGTTGQQMFGVELIKEETDELTEAILKEDRDGVKDGCVDLMWMIVNNLVFNGISFEEFEEYANRVSMSNWSKFCTTEETAQETVNAYLKGEHWDKPGQVIECYWERVGSIYVIKRHDGKVLKSLVYQTPKDVHEND